MHKCSNYSKRGRALLHCHRACSTNNHLHCGGGTFFLFICVRFCHCRILCNNNNVITRRRGGGRGGRCMQQHSHCAYNSNNHLHRFGGVNFFLFVCVRFYHCCVLCSNNNIVMRGGGRRCTSGATIARGGGRHYHARQRHHHTCNSKSHFHHFARGIFFICLCEVLPLPHII